MFAETELGFEHHEGNAIFFFGKKSCTIEDLKKAYPQVEFRTVKQTHSKIVIPSQKNSENIEADAHYTYESNLGLIVRTADCIPLLIYSQEKNIIAAVHAGWRGVENQITIETLKAIPPAHDIKIYIGPHILKDSFEVQEDVKNLLVKSLPNVSEKRGDKYYVDLQKIVLTQIYSVFPHAQITQTSLDTFNNPQYNSFRTDKTTQRNLSFIVQKTASV